MTTLAMTPSEVLLRAAEIVEERWQQGSSGEPGGPRCAIGAIEEAIWGDDYPGPERFSLALEVKVRVRHMFIGSIALWNDAPGRTKEQVAAKLREAAATKVSE